MKHVSLNSDATDGLVTGREERRRIERLVRVFDGEGPAVADQLVDPWRGRAARRLADKDASMTMRKVLRGRPRRRARRLARVAIAGKVLRGMVAKAKEQFEAASDRVNLLQAELGTYAVRNLSTRALRSWKVLLGIGDTIAAGVAYAIVFDLPLLFGGLLALTTAGAFILAASLAGDLKRHLGRARDQQAVRTIVKETMSPQLKTMLAVHLSGGDTSPVVMILLKVVVAIVAAGCAAVGIIRAIEEGNVLAAVALVVLTALPIVATAVGTWRHDSFFADVVEAAEKHKARAGRELRALSRNRILRQYAERKLDVEYDVGAAELEAQAHRKLAGGIEELIRDVNSKVFGRGAALPANASPEATEESDLDLIRRVRMAGELTVELDKVASNGSSNGSK
ncbi:MAG: hypothetical protein M3273_00775 [Actinomycetota bacterium]|nr:hypothetical protein [Actinomycetota bacterium]